MCIEGDNTLYVLKEIIHYDCVMKEIVHCVY